MKHQTKETEKLFKKRELNYGKNRSRTTKG